MDEDRTAVGIVLYEGFDELDAVGPYEVLRNAAAFDGNLSVGLYTLDPAERVTASHGMRVEPNGTLPDDLDLLIVPGGGWNDRAERGAWGETERGVLPDAVARHHATGTTVAAVCTGAMILAAGGLLDGRPAVTHASALDDLRATGAEVVDARVVDDGDVVTAGGVTSGIDLALSLVERYVGEKAARTVATELEYERRDGRYGRE